MGTKMLRGPSLKSLSLLRTFYLLQIMILTISGEKGCYLDNFSSQSGKNPVKEMLGTIPSQGCQLSLLRTFWYQNELPKSFGSRDRILPKYGHGRGHFLTFRQFLKFIMPANYLFYYAF